MILIQKAVASVKSLWPDTRGSSEAMTQALLFMVIITTAASISVVGGDYLDDVQGGESVNQAITSFENVDDTILKMSLLGSENEFTTASQSGTIRSINAELARQEPTIISIDSGGTYEVESRPLTISNMDYEVTYDTGIIQMETFEGVDTMRTLVDQSQLNRNMFIFRAISYADDIQFQGGDSQRLLISQQSAPETVVLAPGDTITANTEHPQGWEETFERHPRLESVTVTPASGDSRFDVQAQVDSSGDVVVQASFIVIESTSS